MGITYPTGGTSAKGLEMIRIREQGWVWWNGVVDGIAFIVSIPFMPLAGLLRAVRRARLHDDLSTLEREYERSHRAMQLEAQQGVQFLDLYLRKHAELQRRFYYHPGFRSPRDARVGARFYDLAERQLMAAAERVAMEKGVLSDELIVRPEPIRQSA